MDREDRKYGAMREATDREVYRSADEIYQGGGAVREVYCSDECSVMSQTGQGEYLTEQAGRKHREETGSRVRSAYRRMRRLWQLGAAVCSVTVVAAAVPQSQAAREPAEVVESEAVSEATEAVDTAAVPVETTAVEIIPEEEEIYGQADTLELTAEETSFLEELRAAMESEDVGSLEAVVLRPEFKQLAYKFWYVDSEEELVEYYETYVYTDGAAKRMGLADGDSLSIAFIEEGAYVYLGNISNFQADSYGRYFAYYTGGGLIERDFYKGYFAASQADGDGELSFTIEFTDGNTSGNHTGSFIGVFKAADFYSGTVVLDYSPTAVFTFTAEDGVFVQGITTDATGSYDSGVAGESANGYNPPVNVILLTNRGLDLEEE